MNKSANKIHIALDISFALPNRTLTITNANTPAIIPVVILCVSGVTIIAASAGIDQKDYLYQGFCTVRTLRYLQQQVQELLQRLG